MKHEKHEKKRLKPTQILMAEHEVIKTMLKVLDNLSVRLEKNQKVDLEHLKKAVEFITGFADRCHHAKEEDCFFRLWKRQVYLAKEDLLA